MVADGFQPNKCRYLWLALALAVPILSFAGTQASDTATLEEGTRIPLQLNDYLSTKLNSEGDIFTADVTRPIYQDGRLVIPKGSVVSGSITRIIRPGRFRGKAVMNLLFQSVGYSQKSMGKFIFFGKIVGHFK